MSYRSIRKLSLLGCGLLLFAGQAAAMPEFARKYNMSCATCHSAYPRLNQFGEYFASQNFKLPNWREGTQDFGDNRLALPERIPLAVRAQAFAQAREGENIDPETGESRQADTDFQSPYLIKLLSSAPLSEHITYYFYGILAEKGENGETLVEDAWFRHDDIFGTGTGMQLGQFQISDLMFPRETRLPFQDYIAYRLAGITYDRGVLFDRPLGPLDIGIGLTNGNGITDNFDVNSPGFSRPDNMFDNDNSKTVFGRIGAAVGPVNVGLFGLDGEQRSAAGAAGLDDGDRDADKRIIGVDLSGTVHNVWHWYLQYLWNDWSRFLDATPGRDYEWGGGFLGVDYIPNDRWAFSALYNYADANDFEDSDTIYEGIDINSLSFTTSYYFMRNLKGIMEVNVDFLDEEDKSGTYYTGHLTREHYVLFGFDAAY